MTTYLITGCAGFIGSNFVYYMLSHHEDIKLINTKTYLKQDKYNPTK